MNVMYVTKQTIAGVRRHKTVVLGFGVLDSLANALYLAAVRHGLMSIVAVIISLYPASTLVLATGLDKEKVHRSQGIGLVVAAVALVLIMLA
jgi:drug/metabolite transporter (DMT)-like permease